MGTPETYSGEERRRRDRAAGIKLRRRQNALADKAEERRLSRQQAFDIASALEMHLDQVTTRRGMIALLESWLGEAAASAERDANYMRAVESAIEVMAAAPDPVTAIAVLQRSTG